MNTLTNRIRAFARDERGLALPDVIFGVIVTAITASMAISAISTFGFLQANLNNENNTSGSIAQAETRFRSDAQRAQWVTLDEEEITFTVGLPDDQCSVNTWSTQTVDDNTALVVTQAVHETNATHEGGGCSGPLLGDSTSVILAHATGVSFTAVNPGGRVFAVTDTGLDLTPETKPESTTNSDWLSARVAQTVMAATTTVGDSTERVVVTQNTPQTTPSTSDSPLNTVFVSP